jgi:hypothetical protein
MRMIHLPGASSVSDPVHGTANAGPDGIFDLPQPFAEHLLKTAAGTWRTEAAHIAQLARESLDELRDPAVALKVLSELRERVASLETQLAALGGKPAPAPVVAVQASVPVPVTGLPPAETPPSETAAADKSAKKTAAARKGADKPPATRPA